MFETWECMYVCLRHTYIHTYIHTYMLSCPRHTYIHTYTSLGLSDIHTYCKTIRWVIRRFGVGGDRAWPSQSHTVKQNDHHKHTQTDKQTDRQTDKQTNKHTDTQTSTKTMPDIKKSNNIHATHAIHKRIIQNSTKPIPYIDQNLERASIPCI